MDLGTQYHLTRYAFLYESIVLSDGSILVPSREEGLWTAFKVSRVVHASTLQGLASRRQLNLSITAATSRSICSIMLSLVAQMFLEDLDGRDQQKKVS